MAIKSKKLTPAFQSHLLRQVKSLIKKGLISGTAGDELQLSFCMEIQNVHKKQLDSLAFGKPEGVRVFLVDKRKIAVALDFLYHNEKLRFSAAHTGESLDPIVKALNALEKKYRGVESRQTIELIHFLLLPELHVVVKTGSKRDLFYLSGSHIRMTSKEHLKKKVKQLLETRTP